MYTLQTDWIILNYFPIQDTLAAENRIETLGYYLHRLFPEHNFGNYHRDYELQNVFVLSRERMTLKAYLHVHGFRANLHQYTNFKSSVVTRDNVLWVLGAAYLPLVTCRWINELANAVGAIYVAEVEFALLLYYFERAFGSVQPMCIVRELIEENKEWNDQIHKCHAALLALARLLLMSVKGKKSKVRRKDQDETDETSPITALLPKGVSGYMVTGIGPRMPTCGYLLRMSPLGTEWLECLEVQCVDNLIGDKAKGATHESHLEVTAGFIHKKAIANYPASIFCRESTQQNWMRVLWYDFSQWYGKAQRPPNGETGNFRSIAKFETDEHLRLFMLLCAAYWDAEAIPQELRASECNRYVKAGKPLTGGNAANTFKRMGVRVLARNKSL